VYSRLAPFDALMGETTSWRGLERNAVWRNVAGLPSRVVHTPHEQADHEARLVADLRLTASSYPADRSLRRLIAGMKSGSARFAELWDTEAPPRRPTSLGRRPSSTRWSARSRWTATAPRRRPG
jgi:hypothetical protein